MTTPDDRPADVRAHAELVESIGATADIEAGLARAMGAHPGKWQAIAYGDLGFQLNPANPATATVHIAVVRGNNLPVGGRMPPYFTPADFAHHAKIDMLQPGTGNDFDTRWRQALKFADALNEETQ